MDALSSLPRRPPTSMRSTRAPTGAPSRSACAVTADRGAAEDIVQDAFVAAHAKWDTIGRYDDPSAWIRRVVLNKSANRWRRLGREVRAMARLGQRTAVVSDVVEPSDARFWAAVSALPTQQAKAIALHYIEDMSVGGHRHPTRVLRGGGQDPSLPRQGDPVRATARPTRPRPNGGWP